MATNIKDVLAEHERMSRDSDLPPTRRQTARFILETYNSMNQALNAATVQQAAYKKEQHRAALFEQALRDILANKTADPERQAFEMRRIADKAIKSSA
jgi:hypothetical protein